MKDRVLKKDYRDYKSKNIAIIGHMGSGKSFIGRLIGKKLGYKHIDSDKLIITKTGKSIQNIFQHDGEEKFRDLEEKTIIALNIKNKLVLSLGGGSILSATVRKFLINNFITLFLDTDLKLICERLKKSSKRPLLLNVNVEEKIEELDIIRRKYYLLADIVLKNINKPEDIIINFIEKYNKLDEKNN